MRQLFDEGVHRFHPPGSLFGKRAAGIGDLDQPGLVPSQSSLVALQPLDVDRRVTKTRLQDVQL